MNAASNNGMHPTRDTLLVINLNLLGGRVMPGVRLLTFKYLHTHQRGEV
jgi:hypothetical protein